MRRVNRPAEWWIAVERHDGWYDLYAYPPQPVARATSAAGLVRMVRDGWRVEVRLRYPPGWVCDLVVVNSSVRWYVRPRPAKCRCGVCRECVA